MLNGNLDLTSLGIEFKKKNRILIADFLDQKFAESVYTGFLDLSKKNLWFQSNYGNQTHFDKGLFGQNAVNEHFCYKYEKYPLTNLNVTDILKIDSRRKGINYNDNLNLEIPEDHPLKQLVNFLNSNEINQFISTLTGFKLGESNLVSFASKYTRGDFHAPIIEENQRILYFILYMTKNWLINWGGNLVILDSNCSKVLENYTPEFNQMIIFDSISPHAVLPVSMYSQEKRYAIEGWYGEEANSGGRKIRAV
jgi:Rps23 Pro-64 3,4-dihydroxylase Tpa1-like proline 4-hydroxylase